MNDSESINNISIFVSGIIIAIVVFLVGMLIDFVEMKIALPDIIKFVIRPVMYAVTIIFTQYLIEKNKKYIRGKK